MGKRSTTFPHCGAASEEPGGWQQFTIAAKDEAVLDQGVNGLSDFASILMIWTGRICVKDRYARV